MKHTRWNLAVAMFVIGATLNVNLAHAELYRHFKLDDGAGDVATDSSPNAEHGEIFDAEFVESDRGTVLEFDGEFSWVEAGFIPVMDLDTDFTWAFWENQADFQASPSNEIILGNRYGEDGSNTSPREFIKFTANRFEYHMNGGHDNDMPYGADDPEYILGDEEWRHHVVVKDGESLTYYRDGEYFNEHEIIDPMFSEDPLPFAIGGQGAGVENWAGMLSDIQLYTQALTEEEVMVVMSGGVVGGEVDPVVRLDDGSLLDPAERLAHVHDVLNTWMGDSNLDGEFNSADLVVVFSAGEYEDVIAGNSTWGSGDWNGDSEFNSSDLVTAFSDGGYEQGARAAVAAVPEPGTLTLLSVAMLFGLGLRRRR